MEKNNNSKDLQSEKEINNKVEANDKVEKNEKLVGNDKVETSEKVETNNQNNNQPGGNQGQPNGQFNNHPNGNQGQPNGQFNNRPNGNQGQPNGQFNNRPNGNYGQPNGHYNNRPNGNYGQPNGQYNNQQYGNYNQPNGQYNNQQYGNYNQPNGQYNNQQYGNYNQPNGQYNNQQYGNYNQPNGQYNNQQSNNQFSNYLNNVKNKISNLTKKQIITGSVILAVLIAAIAGFMYFSNNVGASSPRDAVEGYIKAVKKEDYVKAQDYIYYPSKDSRKLVDDEIKRVMKEDGEAKNNLSKLTKKYKDSKVLNVKVDGEYAADVKVSVDEGDSAFARTENTITVKKIDGKWYITDRYL